MSDARQARLAAALAGAFAVACGATGAGPQTCQSSSDCSADAYCLDRVCRADAAPVAIITAPATPATFSPTAFDGSASTDSDPGDAIASYSWSISRISASCDAAVTAGAGVKLETVFTCPGTFQVQLVVRDGFGVASAPARLTVSVAPTADPPTVAVGPDLSLDHGCEGTPGLCSPRDSQGAPAIQLSAVGSSPVGGSIAYLWTIELPAELDGKPAPRVAFSPSAWVPSPTVLVETDGTAIAGTYRFVVRATDERGLVAIGAQSATVGNRPPVVQGGATVAVAHAYSATSHVFTAGGATTPLTVADPDGDPTTPLGFGWNHVGDGGNHFAGIDQGDHATFAIAVAYGAPADAAYLIGGPGLSRTVTYTVVDANGAEGAGVWDIVVDNRPPRVAAPVAGASVPHRFDAATSRYLASAALATYVDDDGDPIEPVPGTGDAVCTSLSLAAQALKVDCALAYAGFPIANQFAGPHPLAVQVRDPWATSAPATPVVTIQNRPPWMSSGSYTLAATCVPTHTCCLSDPGPPPLCESYATGYAEATGTAPGGVADDDGDPVQLTFAGDGCAIASASPSTCLPAQCPQLALRLCGKPASCDSTPSSGTVSATVSDGDLSTAATLGEFYGGCM
jgi:hypothetical protein